MLVATGSTRRAPRILGSRWPRASAVPRGTPSSRPGRPRPVLRSRRGHARDLGRACRAGRGDRGNLPVQHGNAAGPLRANLMSVCRKPAGGGSRRCCTAYTISRREAVHASTIGFSTLWRQAADVGHIDKLARGARVHRVPRRSGADLVNNQRADQPRDPQMTDVVGVLPDRDSVIRLVGAVLAEQHVEWAKAALPRTRRARRAAQRSDQRAHRRASYELERQHDTTVARTRSRVSSRDHWVHHVGVADVLYAFTTCVPGTALWTCSPSESLCPTKRAGPPEEKSSGFVVSMRTLPRSSSWRPVTRTTGIRRLYPRRTRKPSTRSGWPPFAALRGGCLDW